MSKETEKTGAEEGSDRQRPTNPFEDSGEGFSSQVREPTRTLLQFAITSGAWNDYRQEQPETAEIVENYFGTDIWLSKIAKSMRFKTALPLQEKILSALAELKGLLPADLQKKLPAGEFTLKSRLPRGPETSNLMSLRMKERWKNPEYRKEQLKMLRNRSGQGENYEEPFELEISMWEIVKTANLVDDLINLLIKELGLTDKEFNSLIDFCEGRTNKSPSERVLNAFSLAVARLCQEHKLNVEIEEETEVTEEI